MILSTTCNISWLHFCVGYFQLRWQPLQKSLYEERKSDKEKLFPSILLRKKIHSACNESIFSYITLKFNVKMHFSFPSIIIFALWIGEKYTNAIHLSKEKRNWTSKIDIKVWIRKIVTRVKNCFDFAKVKYELQYKTREFIDFYSHRFKCICYFSRFVRFETNKSPLDFCLSFKSNPPFTLTSWMNGSMNVRK